MDVSAGQSKQAPTGLKRPYSADLSEQRNRAFDQTAHKVKVPGLKDIVGFAAPRDRADADYSVIPLSESLEVPANTVLQHYQTVLSFDVGHTMTNSTSINLPRHWFSSTAHMR